MDTPTPAGWIAFSGPSPGTWVVFPPDPDPAKLNDTWED